MAVDEKDVRQRAEDAAIPGGLGFVKGLAVTLKHLLRRSVTQQYPEVKPDLPARTRGVIALKEENCTVCYKCSRECPDWCIYIDAHKETHPPASGGKARSVKVLDRFAIDFALCMYCGICVEVCPFDALFWSPEFEYAEYDIHELLHEKEKLEEWTYTVLPPPPLEVGAEPPAERRTGRDAGVAAACDAEGAARSRRAARCGLAPGARRRSPLAPPRGAARRAAPAAASCRGWSGEEVEPGPGDASTGCWPSCSRRGRPRRVAEGQARRAAMIAARKKAAGES